MASFPEANTASRLTVQHTPDPCRKQAPFFREAWFIGLRNQFIVWPPAGARCGDNCFRRMDLPCPSEVRRSPFSRNE
ncbi:MAG: hypothetical protein VX208_13960 [SAR324 cluster bacterium]|nr:hypothetical protein [SAR324 cluster bacterium]